MVVTVRLTPAWAVESLTAAEKVRSSPQWKKLVSVSLWVRSLTAVAAGLVVFATTTGVIPAVPIMKKRLASLPDLRAVHLGKLFRSYHCPEPHYIPEYLRAAERYHLDYRLLPAVSIRETGCGAAARDYNRWGYHPGRQTFSSIEAGIEHVARQLGENPLYKGKTTWGKLFTYNPLPAYPGEVQRIMSQAE